MTDLNKVKEALEFTIGSSPNYRIVNKCEAALVELNTVIESNGWQDIKEAPKGEKVIVTFTNSLGKQRTAFAVYYLKYTIE